jgi:acetyltransferase-like isoleucine patch superfamily enzyme
MNLLGSSNRAKRLWRKLVTRLIYSPYFGSIGRGSVIMRPLLLEGTRSIHLGSRVQIREGVRRQVAEHRCGPGLRGRVEIGDDSSIEQGLHLTCGESIRIGRFVAITE